MRYLYAGIVTVFTPLLCFSHCSVRGKRKCCLAFWISITCNKEFPVLFRICNRETAFIAYRTQHKFILFSLIIPFFFLCLYKFFTDFFPFFFELFCYLGDSLLCFFLDTLLFFFKILLRC